MRHLIIADIHSNLEAFQAVLDDVNNHRGGFNSVWCLGDVVGYGPEPSRCIKLLKELKPVCVSGNHDLAAVGKLDTSDFNAEAAIANYWTASQLTGEDKEFLGDMPEIVVEGEFTLVHGSPRVPAWEYITSPFSAAANFAYYHTLYCLVGHSHIPFYYNQADVLSKEGHLDNGDVVILGDTKLIINPGGVGQPRDKDPRASYAIYDSEKGIIDHYRVEYDVSLTQEKMEQSGLPVALISRLGWGT